MLRYPPDGNSECKLHLSAEAILYTALHPTPTVSESLESPAYQEKLMINHQKIKIDIGKLILNKSDTLTYSWVSIFKT